MGTVFQPGSIPAFFTTRKLIEQPNNFLMTIYKKCKGSGLFYGPLAVGGSFFGRGLCGQSAADGQWGSSVQPLGTLCFSCCFPCSCVCVLGGGPVPTSQSPFPSPVPREHSSEPSLAIGPAVASWGTFKWGQATDLDVQVSNKEYGSSFFSAKKTCVKIKWYK